ncbi:MAG: (Fe-S)-binding protein [Polyangiaceae bacterium]|nr:(Fe-S)-binding protein [Polyangiaceae bacterium]
MSTPPARRSLLSARAAELETCGYCPKLCRSACPVAEAAPNEALTPWGKMTLAWWGDRGLVATDEEVARTAWACTGCGACSGRCAHHNPVGSVLRAARADHASTGNEPAAARAVAAGHARRRAEAAPTLAALGALPGVRADATAVVLVGCGYLRHAPAVARSIVRVAARLAGGVHVARGCCGLALAEAGDASGAANALAELVAEVGARRLVVGDPGCALHLAEATGRRPTSLAELAAGAGPRIAIVPELAGRALRWLDPCRLGRGLGVYDEPRAALGRALGRAPAELPWAREQSRCSGGGGLLPLTYPDESRAIADARIAEHQEAGGGELVVGCAGSLVRLRSRGARVVDFAEIVDRALGGDD